MSTTISARFHSKKRGVWAVLVIAGLAAVGGYHWPEATRAAEASLLSGRVTSATGEALVGIPVRAHREKSNITVTVYTNSQGDYSYPQWSDVSPGTYSVAIELPEFAPTRQGPVTLTAGKTARADFQLQPRQPSVKDATASEIVAALPGTDEQKHLVIQCDNCHSLQLALSAPRTKEGWIQIIRRMAGERAVSRDTPGTRAFGQKRYLEPLAEYLASIRGPGSSGVIPFKLRPRPTAEASLRLVVTEYDLPRGGNREVHLIRGDRRAAWPHDIIVEPNGRYAYYTDHYAFVLGRLDRRTGEIEEFPYQPLEGMGRGEMGIVAQAQERAGNPGGGAHDMQFDADGNVIFGLGGGIFRFNVKTEEFTCWPHGDNMFGQDPQGNIWFLDKAPANGVAGTQSLVRLDPRTGGVKAYAVPEDTYGETYDMEADLGGRVVLNLFRLGEIGVYDPKTEKYSKYPVTPGSGPRRGEVDGKGRTWAALYWAGRVGMFDPNKREVKEFPLIPGSKPYTPPFPSPYSASVDNKRELLWANDFNSKSIYRIDIKTGNSIEYMMPMPYEIRDLTVDQAAPRPTLWIPAYRPPSKMVKVETW